MTKATNNVSTAGANALRDIKPPVDIPNPWLWVWWTLGILAAAALAYLAWSYWQKRRAQRPAAPVIPAHVRARQKLEQALILIGQPKEFCIAVSDTVRWYLEERFKFHAPERTTEEFLHELRATNLLLPDQKESLGGFLNRCDLVKFAKYEPREPELRDLHDSALRLVEETTPPDVPETTAAPSAPPAPKQTEVATPDIPASPPPSA